MGQYTSLQFLRVSGQNQRKSQRKEHAVQVQHTLALIHTFVSPRPSPMFSPIYSVSLGNDVYTHKFNACKLRVEKIEPVHTNHHPIPHSTDRVNIRHSSVANIALKKTLLEILSLPQFFAPLPKHHPIQRADAHCTALSVSAHKGYACLCASLFLLYSCLYER